MGHSGTLVEQVRVVGKSAFPAADSLFGAGRSTGISAPVPVPLRATHQPLQRKNLLHLVVLRGPADACDSSRHHQLVRPQYNRVPHQVRPALLVEDVTCSMDYAEASRWFVLDYLGHDGVFLLRLIEINHGSSVVTTIVDLLYARYVHNLSQQHPTESPVLSTFDMQDIPGPPGPATGQQPSRVGHVMSSNQTIAKIKNEKGSISRSILNASHLLVSATDLQTVPSLPRS